MTARLTPAETGVTYSITPSGLLLGALSYSGNSQNARNYSVAGYVITPSGFYSTVQTGYDISYVGGTLTINPRALTLTATAASKGL